MKLTINGKEKTLDDVTTLLDVLERVSITEDTGGIAVAVNDSVVPKSRWGQHEVQPDDRIEVIHAVQGG